MMQKQKLEGKDKSARHKDRRWLSTPGSTEHSQAQRFLTSDIFLSQSTQHYVFMDKFLLSRSNPWEHHLASNEIGFLKQDQPPPEQIHWARAISPLCPTPAPSTCAQVHMHSCWPLCRPSPPLHSSTVTLATAELLGSQAVCHGQMPTCCYLETPVLPSISSQAPHSPASSDALVCSSSWTVPTGILSFGWQPSGSALSAHLSA